MSPLFLYALAPYFALAFIGFWIAWKLTKGNVDPWMFLYLAIPIVAFGVGYGFGVLRTLVGFLVTPTLTGLLAVPLATLGGAEGTRQRWGPIPRALVIAGEMAFSAFVMDLTRNVGEC
jgi:hypothetical protein